MTKIFQDCGEFVTQVNSKLERLWEFSKEMRAARDEFKKSGRSDVVEVEKLRWTRLTYNCAHLRLNSKKNKNKLFQNGLRYCTLILDKKWFEFFLPPSPEEGGDELTNKER